VRKIAGTIAVAALALLWQGQTQAAFFSYPKALKGWAERIAFEAPTLAPMAHVVFCMRYPADCEVRHIAFRPRPVELTLERWNELRNVNAEVNRGIVPQANTEGLFGEKWLISPRAGDCNDYAVTKRHELLARGWPSRSLLLAEVVTSWGEHHLVLVVRTREGDYVLDNLIANIRPWSRTRYQWVKVQSPRAPRFWSTVRPLTV
jgi:predicted transglutaminase-like cysteine proteinase